MTNLDKLLKEFKDARSAAMKSEYESDANPEAIRNNACKWMVFEAYAMTAKANSLIDELKRTFESIVDITLYESLEAHDVAKTTLAKIKQWRE